MNKKLFRFITIVCWYAVFVGSWWLTDYAIENGWMTAQTWHREVVILGWFAFGGLSVQFYNWQYKKKQINTAKKK